MSKSTFGWRRAGVAGIASALALGTALAVGGSASADVNNLRIDTPQIPAFNGLSGLVSSIAEPIAPGLNNQPTANFSLDIDSDSHSWNAGNKITVKLDGDSSVANNCSTSAKVASAVGFAAVPDIEVLKANGGLNQESQNNQGNVPSFTAKLIGDNPVCEASGIFNKIEITASTASPTGPLDHKYRLAFSNVKLNAGPETHITDPIGDILLTTNGTGGFNNTNQSEIYSSVAAGTLKSASVVASNAGNDSDDTALSDITISDVRDGTAAATPETDTFFVPGRATHVIVAPATLGNVQSKLDQGGADPTITGDATHVIRAGSIDRNSAGFLSFDVVTGTNAKAGSVTISGLRTDVDNNGTGQVKFIAARTNLVNPNNGTPIGNPTGARLPSISTLGAVQNVVDYDNRLGGQDRYETAAKIYDNTFGNTANAVVSGGQNFPDALGANYLASRVNGGVLLTKANSLPAITKKALIDHHVHTVYLTGGEGAASAAVEAAIEAIQVDNDPTSSHIQVQRVDGANRFETNKAVNQVKAPVAGSSTVLLASGEGFADALSLGPIAYHQGYPVILTDGQTLGPDQIAQLDSFNADRVVIAGGTDSVSQAVEDAIKAKGIDTYRLAGDTRQSTAAKIALWATEGLRKANGNRESGILGVSQGLGQGGIVLTQGTAFADALSAGALGGLAGVPILLGQDANTLGADATSYLSNKFVNNQLFGDNFNVHTIVPIGLTMAVTNSMVNDAAKAIEGTPKASSN